MEGKAIKLIKEYEGKIKELDYLIMGIINSIRKERAKIPVYNNTPRLDELREDKKMANSKKQSYVQFISDIQDLIN